MILAKATQESYNNDPALKSVLHYPSFLMLPLARVSSEILKISGTEGGVDPCWGENPNRDVVGITRTLDAFAHYVYHKSQAQMFIGDLQGKST
jgi:hypothetical protein